MEDDTEDSPANAAGGINKNIDQKQKLDTLEHKEENAFKKLEKNINTVANILKEAKNVHKTIRDAITEAVIHLGQVQEYRVELAETRSAFLKQLEECKTNTSKNRPEHEKTIPTKSGDRPIINTGTIPKIVRQVLTPEPLRKDFTEERSPTRTEAEWEYVNRRKNKKKEENNRKTKRLTEAVAVRVTGQQSYAEVLRSLKTEVNPATYGVKIRGIRRTRNGELLMELEKGSGKTRELRNALANVLSEKATVRVMSQSVTVEICDLDEATEEAEVVDAILACTKDSEVCEREAIKIRAIRKSYGETQRAIITLPAKIADQLLHLGRIKIGWVLCRVRERIQVTKCFRCFGFGHIATNCKGPDRSNLCRKCGKEDHQSKDCSREPHCVVCHENKMPGGHVIGSSSCESFKREFNKIQSK